MSKGSGKSIDVEQLYRDGWRFRVKTSKGKKYVSARRSGDEKGLGVFTQELWNRIEKLSAEGRNNTREIKSNLADNFDSDGSKHGEKQYNITPGPSIIHPFSGENMFQKREIECVLFELKYERARVKMRDCEHSFNGFCQFWKFIENNKNIDSIYEKFNTRDYMLPILSLNAQLGKESRSMYQVSELLCFDCENYTLRVKTKK